MLAAAAPAAGAAIASAVLQRPHVEHAYEGRIAHLASQLGGWAVAVLHAGEGLNSGHHHTRPAPPAGPPQRAVTP
jgi:hypothetical protein